MGFIRIYEGSIEEVLHSGEHDSGDGVLIDYDELFDLVEQAKMFVRIWKREQYTKEVDMSGHSVHPPPVPDFVAEGLSHIERECNRPIHPVLGGKSPYSEFLGT